MEISGLRLIGMIIAFLGLIYTFRYYRGERWRKQNFFLFTSSNLFLLFISIEPNLINGLASLLSLEDHQRGRLISIIVISTVIMWFFILNLRSSFFHQKYQLDQLFRKLAIKDLNSMNYGDNKIKPIMIMIPAYNEANNLAILLKKIPAKIFDTEVSVLVVDDGSSDNTKQVAIDHGYLSVSGIINRGQGAVSRLGYDILMDRGAKIIVTMDADNQHKPEDLPVIIRPIYNKEFDLAIGSRVLGSEQTDDKFRSYGVKILSKVISIATGVKITDCSSGYKAFNVEKIKKLSLFEDQFQSSEVIIESAKKGLKICEVPITISDRTSGESKKGSNLSYGLKFIRTMILTWLR